MDNSVSTKIDGITPRFPIALRVLCATLAFLPLFQNRTIGCARPGEAGKAVSCSVVNQSEMAKRGQRLFDRNCAHCHGGDARGDEGPSLYDLKKSDARITRLVKEGIKGEMPAFGTKLHDSGIQELIAYIRTLKN